jgi:hypothetical protein
VQPDANKSLTQAVDKINDGQTGGGHTVNISINGDIDGNMIDRMKDKIIDALREASERGTPIISSKGVVQS